MKTYIVQELGTSVPLDVVGVEVTPSQLNVDPELVARCAVQNILALDCQTISAQKAGGNHDKRTSVTREGRAMFHL